MKPLIQAAIIYVLMHKQPNTKKPIQYQGVEEFECVSIKTKLEVDYLPIVSFNTVTKQLHKILVPDLSN